MKRTIDFVASIFLLVILSPLLLGAGLAVRLVIGAPVFFRQERPGLNEETFKILKFRTMTDERDAYGNLLSDGDRLTKLGRFLRSSSIDELPELVNVLKGEMSLVGPRPLLVRYIPFFTAEERVRFSIRPGITGWAQVNGRNASSWDERLGHDVWYVENMGLMLDLKIILMTLVKVIGKKDVVVDTQSVMLCLDEERRCSSAEKGKQC